jgi:hypothetical protein
VRRPGVSGICGAAPILGNGPHARHGRNGRYDRKAPTSPTQTQIRSRRAQKRQKRRLVTPSGGSRASTSPRTTRCSPRSRSSRPRPGVKVELSQYPVQDMIPKTVAALDSGTPPDVAYADVYDFQVTGKWAFDGKLEDISDVIDADEGAFAPNTSRPPSSTTTRPRRRPTTLPAQAADMHIQYWKDMLAEAGFKESDIPTTWKDYWSSGATRCSRASAQPRPASASSASASRWAWIRATRSTRS